VDQATRCQPHLLFPDWNRCGLGRDSKHNINV